MLKSQKRVPLHSKNCKTYVEGGNTQLRKFYINLKNILRRRSFLAMPMKNENVKSDYLSPDVEVVQLFVEAGFDQTNLEDPIENEIQNW